MVWPNPVSYPSSESVHEKLFVAEDSTAAAILVSAGRRRRPSCMARTISCFFRITAEPDISQVCASVHTALEDLEGFKDMAWHGTETQLVRSFPTCKMAYEDRIHGMHLRRLGELLACIWPKRIDDPDGFSKPAGWSSGTGWSCSRHLCRLR